MDLNKIIGIGVDIELIQRFRDKPFAENEKFYRRIFTPLEIEYCLSKSDPYPHFAARFCAKEALKKAVPLDLFLGWKDAEVRNDKNGKPSVHFLTSQQENKSILKNYIVHISLSHDKTQAIAFVVVQQGY